MPTASYLQNLTQRLADGLARLPESFRMRHAIYLRAAQNPDGGFSGREGGSDLYYTGFALRGLAVLDQLAEETCANAAKFLETSLTQQASVVDFFSLLYSCFLIQSSGGPDVLAGSPADWPQRVAATLASFRTPDGGYAKTPGGTAGSTYHSFLVGLCFQLLGKPMPCGEELANFLRSRRRDDGGFVEIAPMRRSGTNPTAAAVGMLQILEEQGAAAAQLTAEERHGLLEFLAGMPSMEGGLRANPNIPLADLLSTFTGTWTLYQLGALDRLEDPRGALDYALSLEARSGGFRGGLWDDRSDVEYTFYGLGVVALLTPELAL